MKKKVINWELFVISSNNGVLRKFHEIFIATVKIIDIVHILIF